ncbi:cysteine and histidine-rich protein 1 isoform X1 [Otolemur garnettii]|uniref:cysteine and histidine-rich protein 1 isoform X1 n=1 Tax=Otolemur garnettii TaxID=30611 RepID=UPI000C7EC5CD|nr:cysteine and histidine-rich protein 1 isoform X1 [Otolemur garnettii]
MCAGCFIHLLADARLKEEQATCPNCRCEISKSLCCRNLAVEKAVSELPSECGFCLRQFPRSLLERHQKEECQDRVTQCKYKRIGCPWHGPFHELTVHEAACAHPTKTGNELMEILDEMDQSHRKEMQLYNSIFSLLSFEKIGYTARWRLHCRGLYSLGISAKRASCLSKAWGHEEHFVESGPDWAVSDSSGHGASPGWHEDAKRPQCKLRAPSTNFRLGCGYPQMHRLDWAQARESHGSPGTTFEHTGEQEPGQSLVQTTERSTCCWGHSEKLHFIPAQSTQGNQLGFARGGHGQLVTPGCLD